jgi:hypothetical protein
VAVLRYKGVDTGAMDWILDPLSDPIFFLMRYQVRRMSPFVNPKQQN